MANQSGLLLQQSLNKYEGLSKSFRTGRLERELSI